MELARVGELACLHRLSKDCVVVEAAYSAVLKWLRGWLPSSPGELFLVFWTGCTTILLVPCLTVLVLQ